MPNMSLGASPTFARSRSSANVASPRPWKRKHIVKYLRTYVHLAWSTLASCLRFVLVCLAMPFVMAGNMAHTVVSEKAEKDSYVRTGGRGPRAKHRAGSSAPRGMPSSLDLQNSPTTVHSTTFDHNLDLCSEIELPAAHQDDDSSSEDGAETDENDSSELSVTDAATRTGCTMSEWDDSAAEVIVRKRRHRNADDNEQHKADSITAPPRERALREISLAKPAPSPELHAASVDVGLPPIKYAVSPATKNHAYVTTAAPPVTKAITLNKMNKDSTKYKTELCKSWTTRGSCTYGARCSFAHGTSELQDAEYIKQRADPAKYKTELCWHFTHGFCSRGAKCHFAHGVAEQRRPPARGHVETSVPIKVSGSADLAPAAAPAAFLPSTPAVIEAVTNAQSALGRLGSTTRPSPLAAAPSTAALAAILDSPPDVHTSHWAAPAAADAEIAAELVAEVAAEPMTPADEEAELQEFIQQQREKARRRKEERERAATEAAVRHATAADAAADTVTEAPAPAAHEALPSRPTMTLTAEPFALAMTSMPGGYSLF